VAKFRENRIRDLEKYVVGNKNKCSAAADNDIIDVINVEK